MTLPLPYSYQNRNSRLQTDAKLFVKVLFFFVIFRYERCVHGKSVPELILTSSAIYGHLLRCFYTFQLHENPLNYDDFSLIPENYNLKAEEFALCLQKYQVFMPKEYTVSCKHRLNTQIYRLKYCFSDYSFRLQFSAKNFESNDV